MSAPESYQLEAFSSEGDFGKPPSPTASFDPSAVRWLNQDTRRREVCKIVGRALATISCAVILIICLSWYSYPALDDTSVWPVLCLPGALASFLWDLAEFLTICARHGRGITPKAHIGVELIIACISFVGGGWLLFLVGITFANGASATVLGLGLTESILMVISASIHLALFIRACIERSAEIRRRRPRVMYIPETGQTVYVVAKPVPKLRKMLTKKSHYPTRDQAALRRPPTPPDAPQRYLPPLEMELPPPLPERPGDRSPQSPAASIIKRKPVPGIPRNVPPGDWERHMRPNMRPPPEDYEPSEEELERMRRGDAQPQLIMPGDVDFKFSTSATGMTPADADAREGKYRVNMSQTWTTTAGESSRDMGGARRRP